MTWLDALCNRFYGLVLNLIFRPSYGAKAMRRNFEITALLSPITFARFWMVRTEATRLNGVRAEIVTPRKGFSKTVLYLHGGAYFIGSIAGYRNYAALVASLCKVRVVVIDYRLAPEHPHPAALEDAVSAYQALCDRFPNHSLLIAGDSAGGGLALAAALCVRDRKLPEPAGVIAISAWADLTGSGASVARNADRDVWFSKRHMDTWAPWYAGAQDLRHPYLSPVFGDYRVFPPALLLVGDQEVLLDDSTRIAAQNPAIRVHLGKNMQHVWFLVLPFLSESKRAWMALRAFIGKA